MGRQACEHKDKHQEGLQAQNNYTNLEIFWPFLAFEGRLGGLKDPPEVPVEVKTCKTIHGTYFEGISSQKNWTGLAGGVRNQFWCRSLKTTKSEKI